MGLPDKYYQTFPMEEEGEVTTRVPLPQVGL